MLTFCTNYDQKSLLALMSYESINFQVISMRISEYTIFSYESFGYICFSLHFSGYWRHLYTIWVYMYMWTVLSLRLPVLLQKPYYRYQQCICISKNINSRAAAKNDDSAQSRLYGSTSCCISHGPCQWERAIFDPPQLRDPWIDFHETSNI